MTREWDADTYAREGEGVRAFGRALVDRLELRGDEHVLDAGCGDGVVTRDLLERLPRGRVTAVDGSRAMVEAARATLGDDPRATVLHRDLVELELPEPVDVAFSSATFHWIADHDRLFARLHAALRPGGRLLAQCGGAGNIADVEAAIAAVSAAAPYREHLAGWPGPWNFATPREAVARLERAGFADVRAGLHTEVVTPGDARAFLRTMMLGDHLERLPADLHAGYVEAVAQRLGEPLRVEYVRLTLSARRPPRGA